MGQRDDRLGRRHVLDQHRELVTTETGGRVRRLQHVDEGGGDPPEQLVPLAVSEAVVHGLEVVEVEKEHGEVGVGALHAGQGMLEAVLEERLVGQPGQGVVKGAVGELVLEHLAVGDVPEAVDPADDLPPDALGPRESLDDAAVLERQDVGALALGALPDLLQPGHELVRVDQLVEGDGQGRHVVVSGHRVVWQTPDLHEAAVEVGDLPGRVRHEDAVGGGVQGCGQAGEGLAQVVLDRHLGAGVVRRDDEPLDGRVLQEVHQVQLEGHDAAVVADQPHPDRDRSGGRGPAPRRRQRRRELRTVAWGDDARERQPFQLFGVVPEQPGDDTRDRLEDAVFGDQHDHRAGVVHERSELGLVPAGHLETPAFGQVAHAQEHHVAAEPLRGAAHHLNQTPPRAGVDPNLDRCANFLLDNGAEGPQDELLVVGVHEVEARLSRPVVERASEHPLRGAIPPDDVPGLVDQHDRIGEAQEGGDHRVGLVGRTVGGR